jgi:hypothetical protein
MTILFENMTRKKHARIAGLLYLGLIVFGIASQIIIMGIIEPDDATKTADNLMANEMTFTGANVLWILSEMCWLLLGFALYRLLKPVDETLASLMALIVAVGVAMECINTLNRFSAVHVLNGADYLTVFTADQLNAQAMFHLDTWETGYRITAIVSFGPWLVPAGYLVYRSGFFPKALGILVMLAGIGIMSEGFQFFLLPDHEVAAIPGNILGVLGEFVFCGWLLVMGAKDPEPKDKGETPSERTEAKTEE